jgi:hypothetical protein
LSRIGQYRTGSARAIKLFLTSIGGISDFPGAEVFPVSLRGCTAMDGWGLEPADGVYLP